MRADTRAPSTSHENFPFLHANEGKECDTAGEKEIDYFDFILTRWNSIQPSSNSVLCALKRSGDLKFKLISMSRTCAWEVWWRREVWDFPYYPWHIRPLSLSLHKTTAICVLYTRRRIFECYSVVMFIYLGIKLALRSCGAWGINFNIENRSWSIRIWKRLRLATFWCRRAR